MKTQKHTVDTIDNKKRLDVFLASICDTSRSKIAKYIKKVGVSINGEVTNVPHKFLETDDVVDVPKSFEVPKEEVVAESDSSTTPSNSPFKGGESLPELDILYENKDVIVVNKKAGVLVHPTESSDEATLMDALIAYDKNIATVGDKPKERAGIVHRLDRLTSGVMIIARNQKAFEDLKKKFQKRFVHKKYKALVNGSLEHDYETITLKIARNKKQGRMVARPESQEGRDAVTGYEVLQRYANATEIDIDLHTGRTHQIRVHLHALGHPVVGDTLYKIKSQKTIPFPRLWLHAYRLELALPGANEASVFESPLPQELKDLTNQLHKV